MRNVTSVSLSDHGMPGGAELGIHRALYMACHVLFDGELFESVVSDFDGFGLHFFRHVDVFYDWFQVADARRVCAGRVGGATGGCSWRGGDLIGHLDEVKVDEGDLRGG